jgi:cell wall assembly regulator SMI1
MSANDRLRGMHTLWERLESLMAGKDRPPRLRPPTTESAISAAEATMGLAFPPDFRASLLVHDGQEDGEDDLDTLQWLPNQAPLAPLDRIVDQWHQHCKTYVQFHAGEEPQLIEDGTLYHYFWHPKRIPIAGNPWFDQDNVYIDFIPGPNGVAGQLAMFGKSAFGSVLAPSFRVALAIFGDALESGEYHYVGSEAIPRAKRMNWYKFVAKKLAQRAKHGER